MGVYLKVSVVANGRVAIYMPEHAGANNRGYVLRSRIVMEEVIGRLLRPEEFVHHKNGDKTDDRPENLSLEDISSHAKIHAIATPRGKKLYESRQVLDYEIILKLKMEGYGYKKVSKMLGYKMNTVKSFYRKINSGIIGGALDSIICDE